MMTFILTTTALLAILYAWLAYQDYKEKVYSIALLDAFLSGMATMAFIATLAY